MNFFSQEDNTDRLGMTLPSPFPKGPVGIEIPSRLAKLPDAVNDQRTDYNSIFSLVRKAVKSLIGKERVGLGLALADLPPQLGAYWEVGGNYIVMNRNLLRALRMARRPGEEINSFVFVILMHEYLHSLGILDEHEARMMTARICISIFEDGHPAYQMSVRDPWQVYPFLAYTPNGRGEDFKIVGNFDSESVSYIM